MIQARELRIDSEHVTVTDLFQFMDIPYRITKKAKLALVRDPSMPLSNRYEGMEYPLVLRLEWEVEKGDPEV